MLSTEQFFEHWLVKNYNDFLRGELHETNCYFSLLLIFRSEKKGPIAWFIWNFTVEIPFHHILRLPSNNITEPIDPRRLKVPSSIFYFLFCLYHLFVLELQFYLTKPWRLEQKLPRLWFSYMVCTLRRIFKCAENHFPRWIFLKFSRQNVFHIFLATSTFWGIEKWLQLCLYQFVKRFSMLSR